MSLIDWSDPEVMLSLLLEYVADERSESPADAGRLRFLDWLVRELASLEDRSAELSDAERMMALRNLVNAIDEAFRSDPVVEQVEACVAELERISGAAAS